MIMSSNNGLTFMYRVGGIAVHNERLLVEHDSEHRFCFVPGGRVEYGENAMQALAREVREELGEDATIGRLALVTDNLFELDERQYQEMALYFLIEFAPGATVLERDGSFEGSESGTVFQWIPSGCGGTSQPVPDLPPIACKGDSSNYRVHRPPKRPTLVPHDGP